MCIWLVFIQYYYDRGLIFFTFTNFYYKCGRKKRHVVATFHPSYVNPRLLLQSQYLKFIVPLASPNQSDVWKAYTVTMLRKYRCRLYLLIKTVPRTTINTYTDLWPWPCYHDFCTAVENTLKGPASLAWRYLITPQSFLFNS
jgi:hypothetical protein